MDSTFIDLLIATAENSSSENSSDTFEISLSDSENSESDFPALKVAENSENSLTPPPKTDEHFPFLAPPVISAPVVSTSTTQPVKLSLPVFVPKSTPPLVANSEEYFNSFFPSTQRKILKIANSAEKIEEESQSEMKLEPPLGPSPSPTWFAQFLSSTGTPAVPISAVQTDTLHKNRDDFGLVDSSKIPQAKPENKYGWKQFEQSTNCFEGRTNELTFFEREGDVTEQPSSVKLNTPKKQKKVKKVRRESSDSREVAEEKILPSCSRFLSSFSELPPFGTTWDAQLEIRGELPEKISPVRSIRVARVDPRSDSFVESHSDSRAERFEQRAECAPEQNLRRAERSEHFSERNLMERFNRFDQTCTHSLIRKPTTCRFCEKFICNICDGKGAPGGCRKKQKFSTGMYWGCGRRIDVSKCTKCNPSKPVITKAGIRVMKKKGCSEFGEISPNSECSECNNGLPNFLFSYRKEHPYISHGDSPCEACICGLSPRSACPQCHDEGMPFGNCACGRKMSRERCVNYSSSDRREESGPSERSDFLGNHSAKSDCAVNHTGENCQRCAPETSHTTFLTQGPNPELFTYPETHLPSHTYTDEGKCTTCSAIATTKWITEIQAKFSTVQKFPSGFRSADVVQQPPREERKNWRDLSELKNKRDLQELICTGLDSYFDMAQKYPQEFITWFCQNILKTGKITEFIGDLEKMSFTLKKYPIEMVTWLGKESLDLS